MEKTQAPITPALTPQFCFDTSALKAFLRLSRAATDDAISQHLSSLSQPSHTDPFNPLSTSSRQPSSSAQPLNHTSCTSLVESVLYPAWSARDHVLRYCAGVATSDDLDDPDAAVQEARRARWNANGEDERTDPYSGRERESMYVGDPRREVLESIVRTEKGTEDIIRRRTVDVVGDRCGVGREARGIWRTAGWERWEKRQGSS